jgi:predicted alpha/beta-hydrolase family hydrolase
LTEAGEIYPNVFNESRPAETVLGGRMPEAEELQIVVDATHRVSALLVVPAGARTCYVLAHGAGAGMRHRAMAEAAAGLAERGIATLRYQFPYMEAGGKRPDPAALCHATVRAAVAEAARRLPALALFAGGRSFGGRMTSQAQAISPLPGVRGLIFLAFPLHPAGRPSSERSKHLFDVQVPMLFLQGTRDALADLEFLRPLVEALGERATLALFEAADHSFHVPAKSGRSDGEVSAAVLDKLTGWASALAG